MTRRSAGKGKSHLPVPFPTNNAQFPMNRSFKHNPFPLSHVQLWENKASDYSLTNIQFSVEIDSISNIYAITGKSLLKMPTDQACSTHRQR